MNSSPLVSVLMAVYNSERYVTQAVESILRQTCQDFELIIIDDGSTDRTLKILKTYAASDSRIHLFNQENCGIVKTRNQLLKHATGEFIAVMDADDIATPTRLEHQVEFLRQHPNVVCVGGAQDWVDEAGRFLRHQTEVEADAEIQQQMLGGCTTINHPTAMFRRAAVVEVGGYDESFDQAEDLDLFLRLGEIGTLANLPETLVQYRQHTQSISGRKQLEQVEFRRIAAERAWARRGIQGQWGGVGAWRPYDRPSLHAYLLHYGWQFFQQGDRFASISYGWRAITTLPFNQEGWCLFVCALVKRLPQPEPS